MRTIIGVCVTILGITFPLRAEPVRLPDGRSLDKIDFDRHVHALLDRQGCNAGACHGSRDGKGGFSLSLLAESPTKDHAEITRSRLGRHVNVNQPDESLLLLKASGQVSHKGGSRIAIQSWEYRLLREWIADGARRNPRSAPLTNLEVIPNDPILQVNEKLQVKVIAHYANGAKEDVTYFSDFRDPNVGTEEPEPSKTAPVTISRTGEIHAIRSGDVGIGVFHRGKMRVLRARVAVPVKAGFAYPKVPEFNFIDREVFAELRKLNIVPSDLSSDEHFLRRVTVDTLGTLPTPSHVREFLASKDPDKRTKKIDELLAHPLHAAMLAMKLCEMTDLVGEDRFKTAQMAHAWFRKRLQENMPYDQIAAGVLTAISREGRDEVDWLMEKHRLQKNDTGFDDEYPKRRTLDHYYRVMGPKTGPAQFFLGWPRPRRDSDPRHDVPPERTGADKVDLNYLDTLAERTAAAFLGVHLDCARCHAHPLDGWTPTDYDAFANLFSQVRLENVLISKKLNPGLAHQEKQRGIFAREVFLGKPANMHRDLETGKPLAPRMLGGPETDYEGDARLPLVRWMIRPGNPFFARHFVNTMWEHYFGVSLVESTDALSSAFAPKNTPLLDLLATDFMKHNFDVRWLERTILLSRTYQLSATTNESNKLDKTCFSHIVPRTIANARLSADMLHASLETQEYFGRGMPAGLHAVEVTQLGTIGQNFYSDDYRDRVQRMMARFGRSELVSRCDPEAGIRSYLFVMGRPEINKLIESSPRIRRLMKAKASNDEIADEAFLATLSRLPRDNERKQVEDHFKRNSPPDRQRLIEDIFWALINSREFMLRH